MNDLDLLDRKIMYELDIDARISASQLAKKLRKSKELINFRIKRLQNNEFIKLFYTVFSTSKIGRYYYKVYVKFKNLTPHKESELLEYISNQKHIAYLSSVEGNYDCIFLVMVKEVEHMIHFLDPFMELYGEYIQEKEILRILSVHRFNALFLHEGDVKKDFHYPISVENYKLDETDKKILDILSVNARCPLITIAKQVGVDAKVVKYRLKRFEKDKIILSYSTSPNFQKLGYQFVQLNIALKNPNERRRIIEYFSSTNRCLFAVELLGKYDLTIELVIRESQELKNIINNFRNNFVNKYNEYEISTITKEHVMVWSPFAWEKL